MSGLLTVKANGKGLLYFGVDIVTGQASVPPYVVGSGDFQGDRVKAPKQEYNIASDDYEASVVSKNYPFKLFITEVDATLWIKNPSKNDNRPQSGEKDKDGYDLVYYGAGFVNSNQSLITGNDANSTPWKGLIFT